MWTIKVQPTCSAGKQIINSIDINTQCMKYGFNFALNHTRVDDENVLVPLQAFTLMLLLLLVIFRWSTSNFSKTARDCTFEILINN